MNVFVLYGVGDGKQILFFEEKSKTKQCVFTVFELNINGMNYND